MSKNNSIIKVKLQEMGLAGPLFKDCEKKFRGWGFVYLGTCKKLLTKFVKVRFRFAQNHIH